MGKISIIDIPPSEIDLEDLAQLTTYHIFKKYNNEQIELDDLFIECDDIHEWLKSEINNVSCYCARQGVTKEKQGEKELTYKEKLEKFNKDFSGIDAEKTYWHVDSDKEKLKIEIPGLREKGNNCGHVRKVGSCGDVDHGVEHTNITCGNRTCSYCWTSWASRQVDRSVERLEAIEDLYSKLPDSEFDNLGNCKHVVFSPPQEWAKERLRQGVSGFKELRRIYNKTISNHGAMGGVHVFHPYRVKGKDFDTNYKAKFRKDCKSGDFDKSKGIWAWLKENDYLYDENGDLLGVYLSPHFHYLGYGYLTKSDKFAEETGTGEYWEFRYNYAGIDGSGNRFVVGSEEEAKKKIKENKRPWTYKYIRKANSEEDKRKIMFYLLSHAGILGDRKETGRYPIQSVSYTGIVGYQDLSMSEDIIKEFKTCDECGGYIFEVDPHGYEEKIHYDDMSGKYHISPEVDQEGIEKFLSSNELYEYETTRKYHVKGYPDITHVVYENKDPPDVEGGPDRERPPNIPWDVQNELKK